MPEEVSQTDEVSDHDLIKSATMRAMVGGVSDMTIYRWLHDPHYADLEFPQAVYIAGRKYWRRVEITKWIQNRKAAA